jgi:hypothetical protein
LTTRREMTQQQHPDDNADPGHPEAETLPDESEPQGAAQRERADEWGAKAAKKPDDTHGAGEHDDPNG